MCKKRNWFIVSCRSERCFVEIGISNCTLGWLSFRFSLKVTAEIPLFF